MDNEFADPVSYCTETVMISVNGDNLFYPKQNLIFDDIGSEHFFGNVSVSVNWSETSRVLGSIVLVCDDVAEEEDGRIVGNKVVTDEENSACKATFEARIPVTGRYGRNMHFRFFDHDGNLLGYSAMEVYKVAAGQTSALLSQDDSTVSELKLTSNAFNPGKSVIQPGFFYTTQGGELKLSWMMPSSYSALLLSFFPDGDVSQKIEKRYLASSEGLVNQANPEDRLISEDGVFSTVFSGLAPDTGYRARLVVIHNDEGQDYNSEVCEVSKKTAIPLCGLNVVAPKDNPSIGEVVELSVVTDPVEATDLGYAWNSSNPEVLSVIDASLGKFLVNGYGDAVVSVNAVNQRVSALGSVSVKMPVVKNLRAVSSSRSVNLSWSSVDLASSYSVKRYVDGVAEGVQTVVEPRFIDSDLQVGKKYSYSVKANGTSGNLDVSGSFSAQTTAIEPATPTIVISEIKSPENVISAFTQAGSIQLVQGQSFSIALMQDIEGVSKYQWYLNGLSNLITSNDSGTKIVTIDGSTKGLNASKVGQEQYLTLKMIRNGEAFSAVYSFTFVNVPVSDVVLSSANPTRFIKGTSSVLLASVIPENADISGLTWHSSNPKIARIDDDGQVTVLTKGAVSFTAVSVANSEAKAETGPLDCVVLSDEVILDNGSEAVKFVNGLNGYGTHDLKARVLPLDVSDSTLVYSSADDSVASVSADGIVTAKGPGSTVITVRSSDGCSSASLAITSYAVDIWDARNAVTPVTDTEVQCRGASFNGNDYQFIAEFIADGTSSDASSYFAGKRYGMDWTMVDGGSAAGSVSGGIGWGAAYSFLRLKTPLNDYTVTLNRQANTREPKVIARLVDSNGTIITQAQFTALD